MLNTFNKIWVLNIYSCGAIWNNTCTGRRNCVGKSDSLQCEITWTLLKAEELGQTCGKWNCAGTQNIWKIEWSSFFFQ